MSSTHCVLLPDSSSLSLALLLRVCSGGAAGTACPTYTIATAAAETAASDARVRARYIGRLERMRTSQAQVYAAVASSRSIEEAAAARAASKAAQAAAYEACFEPQRARAAKRQTALAAFCGDVQQIVLPAASPA